LHDYLTKHLTDPQTAFRPQGIEPWRTHQRTDEQERFQASLNDFDTQIGCRPIIPPGLFFPIALEID
jgi:hypothetical protein